MSLDTILSLLLSSVMVSGCIAKDGLYESKIRQFMICDSEVKAEFCVYKLASGSSVDELE